MGTTFDEALQVARQLPLAERLRLASLLVGEAAGELPTPPAPVSLSPVEARAALAAIRADFTALPGPRPSLGDQLTSDREERARLLGRQEEPDDVDHSIGGRAYE
jgi:hypothetical protein